MDKESIRAYYDSDDFADCYVQCLMEQADASFIPGIIKQICEKEFDITLSTSESEKIFDYIYDNIDEFIEKALLDSESILEVLRKVKHYNKLSFRNTYNGEFTLDCNNKHIEMLKERMNPKEVIKKTLCTK